MHGPVHASVSARRRGRAASSGEAAPQVSGAGDSNCSNCSATTYAAEGRSSCANCTQTYYCPGGTDRIQCPAGFF